MHEIPQGKGRLRPSRHEAKRAVCQRHHEDPRRGPAYTAPPSFRSAGGRGAIRQCGGVRYRPERRLDLSCDELWDIGVEVATPFDDLVSFSDVSELWGLSESALRKVITYGKIISGVDARKYGKAVGRQPRCHVARVRRPGRRMIHGLSRCQALGSIGRMCPFDAWREAPTKTLSAKSYKFKFDGWRSR